MPRNAAGTYSLPAGNPVVTGTTISSVWANATLSDIGTALTGSLARNGDGGMTGQLKADSGTIGAPGIAWVAETTSGFYRAGSGDFRFAIAGVDIWKLTASGLTLGFADGLVGTPSFYFTADTNTGFYRINADYFGASAGGVFAGGWVNAGVLPQMVMVDGTAAVPGLAFDGDRDTGFYRIGANSIGVTTSGALVATINASGIYAPAGSATTPSFSFNVDPDTGIFRRTANVVGVACGGAQVLDLNTTAVTVGDSGATQPQLRIVNGTVGAPGIGFDSDTDTGFYHWGADAFGATSGGAVVMSWRLGQSRVNDGSAATPALTFENDVDTGFYRAGADSLGFAVGGVAQGIWNSNALIITGTGGISGAIYLQDKNAGAPGIAFLNDQDTGLYRIGTDALGFSEGGAGFRIGFRSVPRSTTATTLAIGDVGKCVAITAAINIPISVFSAGDAITIYNDSAGALNLTISAGTLRLAGTTSTGTRSIAVRGLCTIWFNVGGATPEVIASGNVT